MGPLGLLLAQGSDAGSLWARAEPSLGSLALVALLAGLGVLAVVLLLRGDEEPEEPSRAPGGAAGESPLQREAAAIHAAREALERELRQASPTLRGAFASLIAAPLSSYDQRVRTLVQAARSFEAVSDDAERSLPAQRRRLSSELAAETDPRARALLEASLADLAQAEALREQRLRHARLARLELARMRTLLQSLPARVRDLEARQALRPGELGDVEAIAHQLSRAVESTTEVLAEVVHLEPAA